MIDDNLTRQKKPLHTLHTRRLLLLTYIFQHIRYWSKVFQLSPTLFLQKKKPYKNTYKYKEIPIKTPIKSHPSLRLEKLQIIQNINSLMFQVIVFYTPFFLGETDFLPGILSGEQWHE